MNGIKIYASNDILKKRTLLVDLQMLLGIPKEKGKESRIFLSLLHEPFLLGNHLADRSSL